MKLQREELLKMLPIALLTAPPIAYATFVFVYPNVSTPSIEKSLVLAFFIGMLAGIPSGYYITKVSNALVSSLISAFAGYFLALMFYTAPYIFYDIEMVLPDYYYGMFFRMTIILLLIYIFVGFVGVVIGQLLKGLGKRPETSVSFEGKA